MAEATKPYSGPSDDSLPDHVKKLSVEDRRKWVNTFNGVFKETDDEGRAMALANAIVKKKEIGDMEGEKAAPKKSEDGQQFSASDYADVPDAEKPSTWKLRLGAAPGKVDADTIADAITALQPGGFRGNQVQLGSPKGTVVRRITTAINKLDDDDAKKRLRDRLAKVKEIKELAEKALLHGHQIDEKCDECAAPMMPMGMPPAMAPMPYGGATSFDELDAWRQVSKLNMAITDVAYEFRALSDNILMAEHMEAEDKAAALAKLAKEFQDRVKNPPPMDMKDLADDLEDAEKAGRRMGKPQRSMLQTVMENMKKLMSWANYDDGKPDDEEDKAVDLDEMVDKVMAAMHGDHSNEEIVAMLDEMLGEKAESHIVSRDPQGRFGRGGGGLVSRGGAAREARTAVLNFVKRNRKPAKGRSEEDTKKDLTAVIKKYADLWRNKVLDLFPEDARAGFKVFTDTKGHTRWLSYSTNAFEDYEGELFETKALEEAITWHEVAGDRGPLRVFHVPGADIGNCDFQGLIGRMVVESGTFYDDDLGRAAKSYFESHQDVPFGVSIGFLFREGDEKDGVYEWLRFRERSVCPPGTAANPFTGFSIGGVPVMKLDERKTAFLKEMFGEDLASGIIEDAERRTKMLEEANVRHKAGDGDAGDGDDGAKPDASASPAGDGGSAPEPAKLMLDGVNVGEQLKEIVSTMAGVKSALDEIAGFKTRLATVEATIAAIKKSDDEKVAALLTPRNGAAAGHRATQSDANVIDDDKAAAITGKSIEDKTDPTSPYVKDFLALAGVPTN